MNSVLREKFENRTIFLSKATGEYAENIRQNTDDELLMMYVTRRPVPRILSEALNEVAWIKRVALIAIKDYSSSTSLLREYCNGYNKFIKQNSFTSLEGMNNEQAELYHLYLEVIDESKRRVDSLKRIIKILDGKLHICCIHFNAYDLDLHTFANLLGVNPKAAQQTLRNEEIKDKDYYGAIFNGIEDSREEEGWKSNINGMPLMNLTTKNFFITMDENKDLKDKVDNKMFELMPGLRENMFTIKEDDEGNKNLEKYYPPLQVVQ